MFLKLDEEACVYPLAEVKKDLSDWQQRHAVLVLSKSKVFSYFYLMDRLLFRMINDLIK